MRRAQLQTLIESVKVVPLANGDLRVTPVWRGVRSYTEEYGGGPGVLTRLTAASCLQRFLNAHLKTDSRKARKGKK